MGEIAVRQAILHGLVAAGAVEAALRAWRIRRADARLAFWLLALAFPFLVLPALLVAAPFRTHDTFTAGWALFSSDRWNAVRLAGLGIDTLVFALLVLSATLLFLRDTVPFLVEAARERRKESAAHAPPPDRLVALVQELARRADAPAPAITMLRTDASVMLVRGLIRPTLVVSEGALARLSDRQVRAALVHELAHVRFRDPLAGWLLMAARLVMFWNPAVQLVCRAIVQEMEHRADQIAARLDGPADLLTALRALAPAGRADRWSTGRPRRSIDIMVEHLHHAHMTARLAALAQPQPALRFVRTRLVLLAAALTATVFFVV